MATDEITYQPIGVVDSAFETPDDVPKHAAETVEMTGSVEIRPEYVEGLADLEGFTHLVLVTHLHQVDETVLRCDPPFAPEHRPGIFATRGPRRPNPIGVSIVRLVDVDGSTLTVAGLDLTDGTPVLDVKPFAPKPGEIEGLRGGWIEEATDQDFSAFRDEDR